MSEGQDLSFVQEMLFWTPTLILHTDIDRSLKTLMSLYHADDSSVLIVLLETHKRIWESPQFSKDKRDSAASHLSAGNFIEQILVFLRCFLLVSESNKAALFAVHDTSSPLLYASPNLLSAPEAAVGGQHFPAALVKERLAKLTSQTGQSQDGAALSGALSRVLCYLQRIQGKQLQTREQPRKARILCLQASPDISSQYISFMNAIFSAQRHDIVVDACMIGGAHSSLLQQACQLTGGIYSKPARPAAMLEYLLAIYAGDTHSRSYLMLPHAHDVDFRASCFCHKKAIDLGYVCSVCLSIFCETLQECSTCGTVFPAQELRSKRKAQPLAGSSAEEAR